MEWGSADMLKDIRFHSNRRENKPPVNNSLYRNGDAALTSRKGKYKDTGIPLKVNRKIIIDV